jgi:hypothetical protein
VVKFCLPTCFKLYLGTCFKHKFDIVNILTSPSNIERELIRAIPFKIYLGGGKRHLFQPPPNRKNKFHPPPPEFTSKSTPLPPEKKIIKIISFIDTPRALH